MENYLPKRGPQILSTRKKFVSEKVRNFVPKYGIRKKFLFCLKVSNKINTERFRE